MHQFVSVNGTDDDSMNFRCFRYNLDDVTFGKASDNIDLCPKDACLPELPLTNPSWRTCKRKLSRKSGAGVSSWTDEIRCESECMTLRKMEFI